MLKPIHGASPRPKSGNRSGGELFAARATASEFEDCYYDGGWHEAKIQAPHRRSRVLALVEEPRLKSPMVTVGGYIAGGPSRSAKGGGFLALAETFIPLEKGLALLREGC